MAETANHCTKADGKGQGDHKRGNSHTGSAEVSTNIPGSYFSGETPEMVQEPLQYRPDEDEQCPGHEGYAEEKDEDPRKPHVNVEERHEEERDAEGDYAKTHQGYVPRLFLRLAARRPPAQSLNRIEPYQFLKREKASQETRATAKKRACQYNPVGPGRGSGPEKKIEISDRIPEEAGEEPAEQIPEDASESPADDAEEHDFHEKRCYDLLSVGSKAP
ncbi:MAG: hypothetical protein A4E63_01947 [Syntrophorhabdus sp. PtaU1.Bin050]|nr:MAG: hypothetical protein A4E63_01947 [Syntrophorhabdus sp. PtaU1.Bin050]